MPPAMPPMAPPGTKRLWDFNGVPSGVPVVVGLTDRTGALGKSKLVPGRKKLAWRKRTLKLMVHTLRRLLG
jgi:hypothetical protein